MKMGEGWKHAYLSNTMCCGARKLVIDGGEESEMPTGRLAVGMRSNAADACEEIR
jgi:hypothetical protein